MKKFSLLFVLLIVCLVISITQAFAAVDSINNNFTMINPANGLTGGANDVHFTWDGTMKTAVAVSGQVSNATLSSSCPFFGFTWSAHDVAIYGPGTYTVYSGCPAGSPGCGTGAPITFTVGTGELGGHILFNWNVSNDLDVVNVWIANAVFAPSPMWTGACGANSAATVWGMMSTDFNGDGINGAGMVDGPFVGFNANFNLIAGTNLCMGVNCDDGNLCTADTCDPATGTCVHTAIICNDNDPCTDDTCNPAAGCVFTPNNTCPGTSGNNFTMIDPNGGLTGGTNDVHFTWDGSTKTFVAVSGQVSNATLSSPCPFFGITWSAHDVAIYGPGTYTVYAGCPAGSPGCGIGAPITFTVGAGELGGHVLFDWGGNNDLDVVNVWKANAVFAPSPMWTGACGANSAATVWGMMSTDFNGDGINGAGMVDGPFVGFNANFNLIAGTNLCMGVNCDDGNLCTADTCDPSTGTCVHTAIICNDNDPCTDDTCNPASGCVFTPNNTCPGTSGNNFTMIDPTGVTIGGTNDVNFTWDGTTKTFVAVSGQVSNATLSSPCPFFGITWSAHDVAIYGPGTYTVYAGCPAGSPGCGIGAPITFTVGAGELGGHILFNWGASANVDVVNVWTTNAVFAPSPMWTGGCGSNSDVAVWGMMSTDFNGDGINGAGMVDGPFLNFNANFNLRRVTLGCTSNAQCNDNNACTVDSCNTATGVCVHTPIVCNDNNACTTDTCDPATGTCVHTAIICNDNDPCTDDTCNPASGCVFTPNNTCPGTSGNNFTMIDPTGVTIGGTNDVHFSWDGTMKTAVAVSGQVSNATLSSPCPFFGITWSAHDTAIYGPGTYTVYAGCPAGSPGCGIGAPITFTVAAGELGGHVLFNWGAVTDVDMINVWTPKAVFAPSAMWTGACGSNSASTVWDLMSKDVDGDGINGYPMVDGPFLGFNANFNLMGASVPVCQKEILTRGGGQSPNNVDMQIMEDLTVMNDGCFISDAKSCLNFSVGSIIKVDYSKGTGPKATSVTWNGASVPMNGTPFIVTCSSAGQSGTLVLTNKGAPGGKDTDRINICCQ